MALINHINTANTVQTVVQGYRKESAKRSSYGNTSNEKNRLKKSLAANQSLVHKEQNGTWLDQSLSTTWIRSNINQELRGLTKKKKNKQTKSPHTFSRALKRIIFCSMNEVDFLSFHCFVQDKDNK